MNISSIAGQASQGRPVSNPNAQMGKDEFLKLLTVQLKYQDPLNPMENTEFIAQMAQFSSLEQLQNMNQSMEQNLSAETQLQTAFKNNLVTSLVGKSVEIPTQEIEYNGKTSTTMTYRLESGARTANLRILDARGQLVRDFELDASVRYGDITWDGQSEAGNEVPAGAYLVVVQASDAGGMPVAGDALKGVQVQAVRYRDGDATIWADGRELSLQELSGVLEGQPQK